MIALRFCFLLAWVAASLPAQSGAPAESAELNADRPGFTTGTAVVGHGVFQFESGFSFGREGDGAHVFSAPSPLIRIGVGDRFEMRFQSEGYLSTTGDNANGGVRRSGLSDSAAGVKWRLWDEKRLLPALAIVPSLSLPIGHRWFTSAGYDPSLELDWSKGLPQGFALGASVRVSSVTGGDRRWVERAISVAASRRLLAGLSGYAEIGGVHSSDPSLGPARVVNGGVVRSLGKNIQVDIEAGRGLTGAGPKYFFAAGLVVRQPHGLPHAPRAR